MKKLIIWSLIVVSAISCADEELGPILTFEKATIGGYIRLVELYNGEYDFNEPQTAVYDYEVDFVDSDKGNLVTEYVLNVAFVDNTPSNGLNSLDQVEYKRFDASQFADSRNGNKGIRVMIPLSEALAIFSLSADDVLGGDQLAFFGSVILEDGTTYSSGNSTGTVRGSAFQGYFDFNATLTCPQPADKFVGDYMLTFEGDNGLGYGPPYDEGVVTITAVPGSGTLREFQAPVLPAIGPFGPYTTRFDMVCDRAVFVLMDTNGLGCGGGGIQFGPALDDNKIAIGGPLDLTDESRIELIFNEGFANGGCAGQTGDTNTKIILTKI